MPKDPNDLPTSPRRRKPYVAPRVVESTQFETLALSCTKVDTADSGCDPYYGGTLSFS